MEKKEKFKVNLLIFGGIIAALLLIMVIFVPFSGSVMYEYYDYEGNYGTSSKCGEDKDGLICLAGNNYIPVTQYSILEKGVD